MLQWWYALHYTAAPLDYGRARRRGPVAHQIGIHDAVRRGPVRVGECAVHHHRAARFGGPRAWGAFAGPAASRSRSHTIAGSGRRGPGRRSRNGVNRAAMVAPRGGARRLPARAGGRGALRAAPGAMRHRARRGLEDGRAPLRRAPAPGPCRVRCGAQAAALHYRSRTPPAGALKGRAARGGGK
jgi:hypothetical protein